MINARLVEMTYSLFSRGLRSRDQGPLVLPWSPDAFVGIMAQLFCSLEEGREPEITGRDNLETIALCEAVRASAREHRLTTVRQLLF